MQVKNLLIPIISLVSIVEAQNASSNSTSSSKNAAVGQYELDFGNKAALGAIAAGAIAYLL